LTVAAAHSRTFYGLLARYQLGLESDLNFEASFPDRSGIDKLAAIPGGARALALAQIGQNKRAEQELLRLNEWNEPSITQAMLALAQSARLAGLGLEIANRARTDQRAKWSERIAMCAIARVFAHPDFRSWLKADSPAMSPACPLNPQQQTFRPRVRFRADCVWFTSRCGLSRAGRRRADRGAGGEAPPDRVGRGAAKATEGESRAGPGGFRPPGRGVRSRPLRRAKVGVA